MLMLLLLLMLMMPLTPMLLLVLRMLLRCRSDAALVLLMLPTLVLEHKHRKRHAHARTSARARACRACKTATRPYVGKTHSLVRWGSWSGSISRARSTTCDFAGVVHRGGPVSGPPGRPPHGTSSFSRMSPSGVAPTPGAARSARARRAANAHRERAFASLRLASRSLAPCYVA